MRQESPSSLALYKTISLSVSDTRSSDCSLACVLMKVYTCEFLDIIKQPLTGEKKTKKSALVMTLSHITPFFRERKNTKRVTYQVIDSACCKVTGLLNHPQIRMINYSLNNCPNVGMCCLCCIKTQCLWRLQRSHERVLRMITM